MCPRRSIDISPYSADWQIWNKFILIDFNAHSSQWDNKYHVQSNYTGRSLERLLLEEQLVLCSPKNMVTYVDYRTRRPSCLDLCFCSPCMAPLTSVERTADVGSDHYQIVVRVRLKATKCILYNCNKYITRRADWDKWRSKIPVSNIYCPDVVSKINDFCARLITVSDETLKITSEQPVLRKYTCCWSEECHKRVSAYRKAKRKCYKHPMMANIIDYRNKTNNAQNYIKKTMQCFLENLCLLINS